MTFKWKRVSVEDIEFSMSELPDEAYWELVTEAAKGFYITMHRDGRICVSHELFATPDEWHKYNKWTSLIDLVTEEIADAGSWDNDRDGDLRQLLDAIDNARAAVAAAMETHNV